jgi:hypothetical protein
VENTKEVIVPKGYIAFANAPGVFEHEFVYASTEDKQVVVGGGNEVLFVKIDDLVEDI